MGLFTWLQANGDIDPPADWTAPAEARRGGLLVTTIGRAVRRAENLSPGNRLSGHWRRAAQDAHEDVKAFRRLQAARIIDGWIALCVALELIGLLADWPAVRVIAAALAVVRLLEIIAVWSYAVLFEQRDFEARTGTEFNVVALPRSLTHAVVMLGEVVLCFAILVNALRASIPGLGTAGDAVDYSMRTLTTVGVAEEAHGMARFLVDLEPFLGVLFAATVLARLMAGLPEMRTASPEAEEPPTSV
jgi:hypothetical protein